MREWYKKPFTKIILVMIAIVSPAIAAVNLILVAGVAQGMSPEAVFGETEVFEESEFFEELMRSATNEMLSAAKVTENLETEGQFNPDKLVDVMEYAKSGEITGKNSSGLAYTVAELEEWGNVHQEYYENEKSIVVCRKPDDTFHYYWMNDFKKLLSEGTLSLEADSEEQNIFFEELEKGYLWQESRNIVLQDGTLEYTEVWTYDGTILKEYFAPDGAEDILDVVNNTPELNGKLMQVYTNLEEAFRGVFELCSRYENRSTIWTEGNTNFVYLFVNKTDKKIYTNKGAFRDYETVEKDLRDFLGGPDVRYVMVRPRLSEFESNLDVSASEWLSYINDLDVLGEDYIAVSAVDTEYPIQDIFYEASKDYNKYEPYIGSAEAALIVSLALFLIAVVWLTAAAGRRADGSQELYLHPFDHWKTEFSAALVTVPWVILTIFLSEIWDGVGTPNYAYGSDGSYSHRIYYYGFEISGEDVLIISVYAVLSAILFLTGYLSFVRRLKGRTLWKDSILKMLLGWIVKVWRGLSQHIQSFWQHRRVLWKTLLVFAVIVGIHWISVAAFRSSGMILLVMAAAEAAAACLLVRDAIAKERIKKGIQEIASGNLDYKLPLDVRQGGDYQDMAENLNNIGNGLQTAVEKSIRDERLKTDLITNVSHDIKTPLTSIINYVDLLKRENFEDPKIKGYLDILEMKAQRLKTLTEDVVEASKVSSGNITLEYTDVDLVEMLNQTIGEFSEKMEARQLTVIASLPKEPAVLHVDGRRMWRVLENVFNNAAKYAMPGTRVYADLKKEEKG